ncbi:unnamed protein product, partial [Prorocentrum cordatum]
VSDYAELHARINGLSSSPGRAANEYVPGPSLACATLGAWKKQDTEQELEQVLPPLVDSLMQQKFPTVMDDGPGNKPSLAPQRRTSVMVDGVANSLRECAGRLRELFGGQAESLELLEALSIVESKDGRVFVELLGYEGAGPAILVMDSVGSDAEE